MRKVALPDAVANLPKLGFFPGSTIGNMVPRTAVDLLREMRATLDATVGRGAQLLIGFDLVKDTEVLLAAYNDAAGVTAEFTLNLLRRLNRDIGAGIEDLADREELRVAGRVRLARYWSVYSCWSCR